MYDRQALVLADHRLVGGQQCLRAAVDILPEHGEIVSILHHTVNVDRIAHHHPNRLARRLRQVGQILALSCADYKVVIDIIISAAIKILMSVLLIN